jgi:kexin
LFKDQWHLVNDEHPEHMMNTTPVWDMGFSGKDVLVSYIDDGLYFDADDLKDAFVRIAFFYYNWTFFFLTPSLF